MPRSLSPFKWFPGLLTAAAVLLARPTLAGPVDETLRLVPPDTTICLIVRDLRTHARAVAESPFAEWVKTFEYLGKITDPADLTRLRQAAAWLTLELGMTPEQARDDVLGDAVVLAYQPGPAGKPDQESGVLLVRARRPEVLARLVAKINDLQQRSGELRGVREKTHRGLIYFEREKTDGRREFYLTRDGLLAFSSREQTLLGVIDRVRDPDTGPGVVAAGLKRLGLSEAFAACWFDPRGFDNQFSAQTDAAKNPGERAFLGQFRQLWGATDGIALYADHGRGLELGLVASVDESKLPAELRQLVTEKPGGSDLWSEIPEDAILAAGGRLDLPRSLAAVGSFLPEGGRAGLAAAVEKGLGPLVGKDNLPAVLAGLGPSWVVWVTPPSAADAGWLPGWALVLQLGTDEAQTASLTRSALQVLDFAAQMARFGYNRDNPDQIELGEENQDGVRVKFLSNPNGFPAAVRPAYAVKRGHLVLASSPEVVRQVTAPTVADSSDAPLLRFSARHLRTYLDRHRKSLGTALAKTGPKTAETVEKELEQFGHVLEAFDRVEVRYRGRGNLARLSVHIELVEPLAK